MLRKLALAVGAVALCGAVQSQAAFSPFPPPPMGGPSHDGGNSFNGDKGDGSYMGDHGGSDKIIVPELSDNCDVAKWIMSLDSKESHGNVFDALVEGCSPKDLGFCLPKCEMKILGDIQSDITDVDKDFDKLAKDEHGGNGYDDKGHGNDKFSFNGGHDDFEVKELRQDIFCDLTDIKKDVCEFAEGLKDGCHHDPSGDPTTTPTASAVPLPAAASQGLIGLGVLGCLSMVGSVRRRVFGRAS